MSSTRRSRLEVVAASALALLVLASPASPQAGAMAPARKPAAAPRPAAASPAVTAPQPVPTYSYRVEGRRDPFLSLVGPQTEDRKDCKGNGAACLAVGELTLKGILYSRGSYLAMVQGPDLKTYIVHPNDRLADGTIRAITADSLVILQEVNDPLSLTKQREVRKTLRALEEVK